MGPAEGAPLGASVLDPWVLAASTRMEPARHLAATALVACMGKNSSLYFLMHLIKAISRK